MKSQQNAVWLKKSLKYQPVEQVWKNHEHKHVRESTNEFCWPHMFVSISYITYGAHLHSYCCGAGICRDEANEHFCTVPEMGMQQLTGVLAVLSVLLQPTIGMDFHAVLGSSLQKARKIPVLHHRTLALFQGFRKKTPVEVTVQNKGEEVVCCDHRTLQHDPDYCGFCDGAQAQV